jgi:hypothetical protein
MVRRENQKLRTCQLIASVGIIPQRPGIDSDATVECKSGHDIMPRCNYKLQAQRNGRNDNERINNMTLAPPVDPQPTQKTQNIQPSRLDDVVKQAEGSFP